MGARMGIGVGLRVAMWDAGGAADDVQNFLMRERLRAADRLHRFHAAEEQLRCRADLKRLAERCAHIIRTLVLQ